ncbi:unnamed protein product (macronuclear) [Paramecium tetraurelia]|uniref:DUF4200 domain-containing protein n=2 Tax=Paramecium TaxID=5884 RepID=A0EI12_PARTE|nr:uncharacterized protein GSPATT00027280001 [Paramecium tetraurelia]CAD8205799.1 unnamed protein product [Paramecium octaurelia]CAK94953.1 unnamed protein product [Paramecium tetraurelia]|eukprot:XP_001462326.1 hypothetical protein (macronuclear) [Paramecium tetraurelia strain d4-2]
MSYGQNLQVFNPQRFKKIEKEMQQNKKRLEEMRLEEESQNTRLLKVQQKERTVDLEYKDRKKKMEETQEQLAFEAQKFNDEQRRMNQDLESKKDSVVMLNDRKKRQDDERYAKEQKITLAKEQEKAQALNELAKLQEEVNQLEVRRKNHQQYELFFKKVISKSKELETGQNDDENAIKELIDRYERLKKKEEEFKKDRELRENQKDQINQQFNELNSKIQAETYEFNAKYNKLKLAIQQINDENDQKHKEIEGTQNQNEATQKEYIQVIHGIQNMKDILKQRNKIVKRILLSGKDSDNVTEQQRNRKKEKKIDNQKIEKYLNFIKDELQTLQQFKQEFDRYLAKEKERD